MRSAGANAQHEHFWKELLQLSQQQAWSERIRTGKLKSLDDVGKHPAHSRPNIDLNRRVGASIKVVAMRAMEYLTEQELNRLRLPLGSVLRAIEALRELN
jgi:hypothetical protein